MGFGTGRNGGPMMHGQRGTCLSRKPRGALGLIFKTACAHDADGDPQNPLKILPCHGVTLLEPMGIFEWLGGVRGRNGGPMMHGLGGSAASRRGLRPGPRQQGRILGLAAAAFVL